MERWFTPEFVATAPGATETIVATLKATDPEGYTGCCVAIRDMDMRPVVGLSTNPTLVVGGLRDPSTLPSHSEALAAIVGARLEMLEAAHLANVEQPVLFAAAVSAHLSEQMLT